MIQVMLQLVDHNNVVDLSHYQLAMKIMDLHYFQAYKFIPVDNGFRVIAKVSYNKNFFYEFREDLIDLLLNDKEYFEKFLNRIKERLYVSN